jgi:hypothetical protein
VTDPTTALVVTTIKVPEALEWYYEAGPDVPFYVIGDEQAPDDDIRRFCNRLGAAYYSARDQRALGYACSDLLRWRDPARRSIGCLEAVRDGAQVVIMADDDNLPLDASYFADHASALSGSFSGLTLQGENGWADPGALLTPRVRHRGFPHELWHPRRPPVIGWANGLRPGVNAGLVLGDPDIDAAERITSAPCVMSASPVADAGIALEPGTYAPFNAQDTAFRAELLPVMVMHAPAGRFLDIWAAYIAERVMRDTGWVVRYGKPHAWQQRNDHVLARDLELELRGYAETLAFTETLDDAVIPEGSGVLEAARAVCEHISGHPRWADIAELGLAWLKDCEAVS